MKRLRMERADGQTITVTIGDAFDDQVAKVLAVELHHHGGLFSDFGQPGDKIEVIAVDERSEI